MNLGSHFFEIQLPVNVSITIISNCHFGFVWSLPLKLTSGCSIIPYFLPFTTDTTQQYINGFYMSYLEGIMCAAKQDPK